MECISVTELPKYAAGLSAIRSLAGLSIWV
jgi:hypothetical protein